MIAIVWPNFSGHLKELCCPRDNNVQRHLRYLPRLLGELNYILHRERSSLFDVQRVSVVIRASKKQTYLAHKVPHWFDACTIGASGSGESGMALLSTLRYQEFELYRGLC